MKYRNINIPYIATLLLLCLFAYSCTDVIDVELEPGDNQLVVDAWINNKSETQIIKLRRTSPYFDSSPSPAELGATVTIQEEDGPDYNFEDLDNSGNYSWAPTPGQGFGGVGNIYTLNIELSNGKNYQATSVMNRVPAVDSIAAELREESLGQPAGYYCEFFGIDPPGAGDAYWIKTYKNGQFLNKPGEINLAFDAGFTAGAMLDGITFITPIRSFVNRVPDSGDNAIDTDSFPPYVEGDSITVQINSLTFEAFDFLSQARTQLTLGDAGLFAEPPSNVPTNIIPLNPTDPEDEPVGFFNVSAVSSLGRRI